MNKAVLVMDMPENGCMDCVFCCEIDEGIEACCTITVEPNDEDSFREIEGDYCQCKPDWCPLRPMPEKMHCPPMNGANYEAGWNECIETVLGNDLIKER